MSASVGPLHPGREGTANGQHADCRGTWAAAAHAGGAGALLPPWLHNLHHAVGGLPRPSIAKQRRQGDGRRTSQAPSIRRRCRLGRCGTISGLQDHILAVQDASVHAVALATDWAAGDTAVFPRAGRQATSGICLWLCWIQHYLLQPILQLQPSGLALPHVELR